MNCVFTLSVLAELSHTIVFYSVGAERIQISTAEKIEEDKGDKQKVKVLEARKGRRLTAGERCDVCYSFS